LPQQLLLRKKRNKVDGNNYHLFLIFNTELAAFAFAAATLVTGFFAGFFTDFAIFVFFLVMNYTPHLSDFRFWYL